MKILLLTRDNESRHIQSVIKRLSEQHSVLFLIGKKIALSRWFKILWQIEDYRFYFRKMPHQIDYYKYRIFLDWPVWLRLIVPFLPSFRWLMGLYRPPKEVYEHLKKLNPDLIITSSLTFIPFNEDFQYAVAAKDSGIPLVGFTPTWDSLTNKTFIYPRPDFMFCWNDSHVEQLTLYHGLKPDTIYKVGSYTLEKWLEVKSPTRRDKFMKKYGWKKDDRFLLYICSAPTVFDDETLIIEDLARRYPEDKVLVQLHPDKPKSIELKKSEQIKFGKTDSYSYDNYFHCENLWGINSSAFLEALLMHNNVNIVRLNKADIWKTQKSIHFQSLKPYWKGKQTIEQWLGFHKGNIEFVLPSEKVAEIIPNLIDKKVKSMVKLKSEVSKI